jgi:Rrf2 family nitric oxide-sensitive transcriptional repressor
MQLTLHFDYALRTLIFLAAHQGRRVTTLQVSRAYGISKNHLVRVIQDLEKAGCVKIIPGRSGGIELARDPALIRIGEVMRVMETNLNFVECFNTAKNTCPIQPVCRLKGALREAGSAFIAVLDRYTLADVVGSGGALRGHFLPETRPIGAGV